ncbi:MAG TPA: PEP-CTERM sorting domain-containing protein [Tepidisphaeraceae bacterium]|nr:PEP-CTERM sorting domain-containing protein [Tepidisphaeraceae bacterium]
MRYLKRCAGMMIGLSLAAAGRAETIPFSQIPLNADSSTALGIHITPTGPDSLPMVQGGLEVLGVTAPYLNNSITSQYYSGNASLDQPATDVSLDIRRAGTSTWDTPVTLTAFDKGKRVATTTVELPPLGETTRVTVSAPAIDQFSWSGPGWVLHPYYLRDLQISLAAASTPNVSSSGPSSGVATPSVGASLPEPGSIALVMAAGLFLSIRRPIGRH